MIPNIQETLEENFKNKVLKKSILDLIILEGLIIQSNLKNDNEDSIINIEEEKNIKFLKKNIYLKINNNKVLKIFKKFQTLNEINIFELKIKNSNKNDILYLNFLEGDDDDDDNYNNNNNLNDNNKNDNNLINYNPIFKTKIKNLSNFELLNFNFILNNDLNLKIILLNNDYNINIDL
jgi:hypothetical protein